MRNKVKKIFCALVIFTLSQISFANPRTITSYSDLLNSISRGDSIRAIMYVNKCSIQNNSMNSEDAIAGMNFNDFNKYLINVGSQQKNIIATSVNKLVEHSKFGTIYNYVRLRVFEDNTAEIYSEYLDPITYKQLGSMTANCVVSNGHDQNGVLLYDLA